MQSTRDVTIRVLYVNTSHGYLNGRDTSDLGHVHVVTEMYSTITHSKKNTPPTRMRNLYLVTTYLHNNTRITHGINILQSAFSLGKLFTETFGSLGYPSRTTARQHCTSTTQIGTCINRNFRCSYRHAI